ncbi:hypothetical protein B0H13DRAFT_2373014 [Mycena leptocephala]|nr:hypothetical protein B0H13DRAFT_2373014 [Mycena leptocephala]
MSIWHCTIPRGVLRTGVVYRLTRARANLRPVRALRAVTAGVACLEVRLFLLSHAPPLLIFIFIARSFVGSAHLVQHLQHERMSTSTSSAEGSATTLK